MPVAPDPLQHLIAFADPHEERKVAKLIADFCMAIATEEVRGIPEIAISLCVRCLLRLCTARKYILVHSNQENLVGVAAF